jgi:hypothetical protein
MVKKMVIGLLLPISLVAQSKKDIRKNSVKAITEIVVEGTKSHKELFQRFNKKGNVVEEIEYDNTGKVKNSKKTDYNKENDKIEEVKFDANGKQKERQSYKYDMDGEKIEEATYNEKNELINKSIYSYNAKGLRKDKKTYDAKGKLTSTKIYQYEIANNKSENNVNK